MVFAPYIALGSVAPLLVSKRLDEHNIDLGNRLYNSIACCLNWQSEWENGTDVHGSQPQ